MAFETRAEYQLVRSTQLWTVKDTRWYGVLILVFHALAEANHCKQMIPHDFLGIARALPSVSHGQGRRFAVDLVLSVILPKRLVYSHVRKLYGVGALQVGNATLHILGCLVRGYLVRYRGREGGGCMACKQGALCTELTVIGILRNYLKMFTE